MRVATSLDLCLPLRVVDVAEDLETDALVQLRFALRAAIEFLSSPVREHFSIAKHVEQQLALSQISYAIFLVLGTKRNLAGYQEVGIALPSFVKLQQPSCGQPRRA
jgi:hypothetical protein